MIFYTDGSAHPNPGPGGYGIVGVDNNIIKIIKSEQFNTSVTNNEMELTAILRALSYAFEQCEAMDIFIYTDSAYCINIFTQWIEGWKKNGWTRTAKHLPIENIEIIQSIDKLIAKHKIKFNSVNFVKVMGHSGDKWNELVDSFAVRGKQEQREYSFKNNNCLENIDSSLQKEFFIK